jgi:hypothetical protein
MDNKNLLCVEDAGYWTPGDIVAECRRPTVGFACAAF